MFINHFQYEPETYDAPKLIITRRKSKQEMSRIEFEKSTIFNNLKNFKINFKKTIMFSNFLKLFKINLKKQMILKFLKVKNV